MSECRPWKWEKEKPTIYFPHVGNKLWNDAFFEKQIIDVDEENRVLTIMWQGPWKLRYHAPLGVGICEEWHMDEIGIDYGGANITQVFEFIKDNWIEPVEIDVNELSSISDNFFPFLRDSKAAKHWINGADPDRYDWADTSYPLTVISGLDNPGGGKYRVIDGRRRLHKIINIEKKSTAICNVITKEQFKKLAYKYEVISYEQSKQYNRR